MMPPKPKADELLEQMWQEYVDSFDLDSIPEHQFSPEFEKKMEKLIRKQRRIENRPPALRMVRKVAVILVICCAVAFSGLMTVEAFRDRVIHFFTQVFFTHTEVIISTKGYEDAELAPLELGYLPEGMTETERNIKKMSTQIRCKGKDSFLNIIQKKITDDINQSIDFDSEDAQIQNITINNHETVVISEDDIIQMFWTDHNSFIVITGNLPLEEMKKIAENISLKN